MKDILTIIISALGLLIAFAAYRHNKKNKNSDSKTNNSKSTTQQGEINIAQRDGGNVTIDNRKTTVINNSDGNTQSDLGNKKVKVNLKAFLILMPTTLLGLATYTFISSFVYSIKPWGIFIALLCYFGIFYTFRNRIDHFFNIITHKVMEASFLSSLFLLLFNIDIDDQTQFIKLKLTVVNIFFLLLCLFIGILMVWLLINHSQELMKGLSNK